MTNQELSEKCKVLDRIIYTTVKTSQERTQPIADGILDVDKYMSASHKVLWILKEPYDEFDSSGKSYGGGWHIKDALLPKMTFQAFIGGKKTFEPMIYTTWGILNNFATRSSMNNVSRDPSMLEALKSCAYINVKKIPGQKTSPPKLIQQAYKDYKYILLKQVEDINADIIIGGGTLQHFYHDLDLKGMKKFGSCYYVVRDDRLYIKAYHPAQRPSTTRVSQEQYCNDIINVVKNWKTNNLQP